MQYLYLLLNVFSILGPLALSFDKRVAFYKNWKALFPSIFIMMLVFIPWDVAFEVNGIWGFNDQYLCGIRILHLPIEEWLFFITVPYACVFIYECVIFYTSDFLKFIAKPFFVFLAVFLLAVGVFYWERSYTFYNFIGTGLLLLFTIFIIKPNYLGRFLLSFLIALIPFILINGVLTGTGIDDQVVWYSSGEIIGLRIFTIPIEDTVYCLFMLLLTILSFEKLKLYFLKK